MLLLCSMHFSKKHSSFHHIRLFFAGLAVLIFATTSFAQIPARQVKHNFHTWTSINSTMRFTNRWGMMADVHVRRNNGVKDASFYFARIGANYWLNEKITFSLAYGHLWLAPTTAGWKTFGDEHRIHQQVQYAGALGKVGMLQRIRNEQRWAEKIANDQPTGKWRFTNRLRYLINFNIPLNNKPHRLSLVLADEIMMHQGKEVVYNSLDQNRIFIGIRQNLGHAWSYDAGYMNVYQQKYSGYQYDMNHTFRLFFYYTPDFRKSKTVAMHVPNLSDE